MKDKIYGGLIVMCACIGIGLCQYAAYLFFGEVCIVGILIGLVLAIPVSLHTIALICPFYLLLYIASVAVLYHLTGRIGWSLSSFLTVATLIVAHVVATAFILLVIGLVACFVPQKYLDIIMPTMKRTWHLPVFSTFKMRMRDVAGFSGGFGEGSHEPVET